MTHSADPSPSPEVTKVTLEKPVYGGACLARVDGKAVFVALTLPGEQARIRITQFRSGYCAADVESIVSAAPERVVPDCPHYGACGGCHYQHASYEAQLAFKQSILRETLTRAGVEPPAEISVLSADPWAYRNRIRLAFDAAGRPGYRGRSSHAVVPIAECPIAAPLLVAAARAASEVVASLAPSLRPGELSLFCDAGQTALLASVIVPAARSLPFESFAESLSVRVPELCGAELVVEPPARSRAPAAPPRIIAQWGAESLVYSAASFDYRVDHGAFFQVNRWLIDALVDRVAAAHQGRLAWDLFAGVGLFARRLAAGFAGVVAVESAPAAARALAANLKGTGGTTVRATTLDFLRRSVRTGRSNLIVPDLIVVDPPRTGLGPEITTLLAAVAAPVLVYVSCDPATLARDLRALIASGYAMESLTLADLFPQTFHLESIIQLCRA